MPSVSARGLGLAVLLAALPPTAGGSDEAVWSGKMLRVARAADRVRGSADRLEDVARTVVQDGRVHSLGVVHVRLADLEQEVRALESEAESLDP